jgi:SAM-dependent methyltransferase
MRSVAELAPLMAAYSLSPAEQMAQTAFRMSLVADWEIQPGMRVLEIGCGQGDTTAALAEAVGPTGYVTAIDLAPETYGAPVSLGASATHLRNGPLGKRLSFTFSSDVLEEDFEESFDVVVLALCTWYFDSFDQIQAVVSRCASLAPRLCLAEWDLLPRDISQLGHLLAVLIQGQIKSDWQGNVRTPYSRQALDKMLFQTGWVVGKDSLVDTSGLADARWEIDNCLSLEGRAAIHFGASDKEVTFIESQLDLLRRLENPLCLNAYSVTSLRE